MEQAFGAAIVVLLVVIAVELLLIHRDILYLSAFRRGGEADGVGQTINVNLGPKDGRTPDPAASEAVPPAEPAPIAPSEPGLEAEDPVSREEASEPARFGPVASARVATSSGLVAKRCAACGMENSSMRSECFNCGATI